jgi:hypothetical protein
MIGWRSTQGVEGPMKCLEHPVSAMELEGGAGTMGDKLQDNGSVL